MRVDWRRLASHFPKIFLVGQKNAQVSAGAGVLGPEVLPPMLAAGGLILALVMAGHYALTGRLGAALLTVAWFAALGGIVALACAYNRLRKISAAQRNMYDLLADHACDLIMLHAQDGTVTFASPAARALLGCAPEHILEHGLEGALSADDLARSHEAIAQCRELATPVSIEIEMRDQAAARWLEFRCEPLENGEEVVSITRDITARRWHAIAMRQARDEAESASRAKSAFIASISHELRTPLNAILGFSEMLERELRLKDVGGRQAEYTRIIRESGEHLMSLVRDLLDVSKIEAGRLSISVEPFRLADVVASSVETLRPAMAAKSLKLGVAVDDDLDEIVADRRACKQMMINLLSNACKFTPEGGHIALEVTRAGASVVIAVRDSGVGIAPDHVARLGQPFYQVETTRGARDGAGLGLAIVRGLADLHGGQLEVESTLGKGSCFRIVLPLDAEATAELDRTGQTGTPAHERAASPSELEARPAPQIALVA